MEKKNTKQIEELTQKIQELEEGWRRTQADFDNFRKRTETQKQEIIEWEKGQILAKLSPVLDNFRRAFEHLDINDPKISGIKQIEKQLEDILASEGLKRVDCSAEFNPAKHEAISYEENADVKADHIIAECESGWEFNGKVIKPAKVRVSKGK